MPIYTVVTPLAVRGQRDPLPPGSTVEMDETAGGKLVSRGVLAEATDASALVRRAAADANTLTGRLHELTGELATAQAALDQQIAATQMAEAQRDAAEVRAQQAEAELAALRAQAVPPSESLPPEEPPPEEPPGKPKGKKVAEAK